MIKTNFKFTSNLIKRVETKYIVLHHADAKKATVEQIHKWHLNNGWSGIGYHIYIDKKGNVYEGRPIDTVGAHCYGYNTVSVGVCAEGDFETDEMGELQKNAILSVLLDLKNKYPNVEIKGHNDLMATACPGKNYPLDELKKLKGVENMTTEQAKKILFERVGLSQETITFLLCYKYGDELVQKIAKAIG